MYEWNLVVQKMIDWIEENLDKEPKLLVMSKHIGYSPYYCSIKFHEVTGRTLKNYISGRKLARAALEIRDSRERILDIALKYGFSSQEALTRAFVSAYGCTPAAYRRKPVPVPILCAKVVLFPEHYKELSKGEKTMNNTSVHDVDVRTEYIPASYYRVFAYPAFDYLKDNNTVMPKVEEKAWNYNPEKEGYEWNEETCLDYQRHNPEVLGYQILRPVRRKG